MWENCSCSLPLCLKIQLRISVFITIIRWLSSWLVIWIMFLSLVFYFCWCIFCVGLFSHWCRGDYVGFQHFWNPGIMIRFRFWVVHIWQQIGYKFLNSEPLILQLIIVFGDMCHARLIRAYLKIPSYFHMNFNVNIKLNNVLHGLKLNNLYGWLERITSHCIKSCKCKLLLNIISILIICFGKLKYSFFFWWVHWRLGWYLIYL